MLTYADAEASVADAAAAAQHIHCARRCLCAQQFTCFTGAKVQILTQRHTRQIQLRNIFIALYLLYWCKSTNTDAETHAADPAAQHFHRALLALLVQKYKY
jgi:hypothetical protein